MPTTVLNHLISVLAPDGAFPPTGVLGGKTVKEKLREEENVQILLSLQTLKRPVLQSPPVWTTVATAVLPLAPRTGCSTTAWAGAWLLASQGWQLVRKQGRLQRMTVKPRQSHKEETQVLGRQAHTDLPIALPTPPAYLLGPFPPLLLMALLSQSCPSVSMSSLLPQGFSGLPNSQFTNLKARGLSSYPSMPLLGTGGRLDGKRMLVMQAVRHGGREGGQGVGGPDRAGRSGLGAARLDVKSGARLLAIGQCRRC